MPASKYTIEEKLEMVHALENGTSIHRLAEIYEVSTRTLWRWNERVQRLGAEGFKTSSAQVRYPKSFQDIVIREYIDGALSMTDLARKYDISSEAVIWAWMLRYNEEEISKSKEAGIAPLTKTRQTTLEERVQIVKYYEAEQVSYSELAEAFNISYQQARNLIKKFQQFGHKGLEDRRGKRKPVSEYSDLDKLAAKVKRLEAEKQKLEVENAFLKKLEELERS